MKIFILLALFVVCAVAHTPESSSEESSSSEEVVVTRKHHDHDHEHDHDHVDGDSSSSEEVIQTRHHHHHDHEHDHEHVEGSSEELSSSEEDVDTRAKHHSGSKKVKRNKKSSYQRADHDTRWKKYKLQFRLKFKSEGREETARKRFVKNRLKVWKHSDTNQNSTVRIELNRFAIMSQKEFKKSSCGLTPETRPEVRSYFGMELTRQTVPESYDSRQIPEAVSYVRHQGDCGGCWAFSTVAVLETIFFLKYKKPYKFSEQHLIDCDGFNDGCDGGTMDAAFNYIRRYEGINALKMYPYEDGRKYCRAETSFNRPVFITEVKGFPRPSKTQKAADTEEMMKVACATYGAVAIGIDAEYMQFYSGGVYTGPCSIGINHGVALVGYGKCEETGLDYWIIKNSWGPDWGERGYLRLKRGNNTCGVAQMASVPIIADNIDLSNVPSDENVGN